jgi:RNA polymerase sigma-70 factor, ECF subfamily
VTATGETSAQMALRDPDVRLMLRVRADEPGAFAELVEQFQHRLVAVMHHVIGDATEAEDLAQEAFLRVYRARKKYRPRSKFSTWLFTIANNLARNSLRSRQRKPLTPLVSNESGPSGPQAQMVRDNRSGPMQKVQRKELAGLIQEALAALSERQRVAVVLNKFEDMNYAEIADVMGLTTKGVKSLLSRARINLRAALAGYVYMDGAPTPVEESDERGDSSGGTP